MIKRMIAFLLAVILLLSCPVYVLACNDDQSDYYVLSIIFGDNATKYQTDEKAKMLLDALYICSEQADNSGEKELSYLKLHKVSGVPTLANVNIKSEFLLDCSHNSWDHVFSVDTKKQKNRKNTLINTTNTVFNFGKLNRWFSQGGEKCESFAALLYYSHILADYLSDDPTETEIIYNGSEIRAYAGSPYVEINGNKPLFTRTQKENTNSFLLFSELDALGREGVAFGNIGKDNLPPSNSRQSIGFIKPSGWNQGKYKSIIGSETTPGFVYNRCHLIAHMLSGEDGRKNLITGTSYLNNEGMKPFEEKVRAYIDSTGNHVLYRVTPVFKGENKLASGVQMEAYSVEDKGKGICFNVYCYNVQPGIDLNYFNGENEVTDDLYEEERILPFVVYNASDNNPDLVYEVDKNLKILFADQTNSGAYISMRSQIDSVYSDAKSIDSEEKKSKQYSLKKECEYRYYEALKDNVHILLSKEKFFNTAFD